MSNMRVYVWILFLLLTMLVNDCCWFFFISPIS